MGPDANVIGRCSHMKVSDLRERVPAVMNLSGCMVHDSLFGSEVLLGTYGATHEGA